MILRRKKEGFVEIYTMIARDNVHKSSNLFFIRRD
jgi:hypothetical protein